MINCYWPEFNKYCGCCEISTGIYIRSIITLVLSSVSLFLNGTILDYLFSIGPIIYSANLTAIEGYNATARDEPEQDLATLRLIYNSLLVYYIMWITFKVIYVATVVFTALAIYKKISWMLKVLLFISVPNWVLDFFISILGIIMVSDGQKIMLVFCNLSEGYNILAMNSEYKRMRGKSRLAVQDIEPEPQDDQIYVNNFITQQRERRRNGFTQLHCRSCTCCENTMNINSNEVRPEDVISTEPTVATTPANENPNDNSVGNSSNAIVNTNSREDTSIDVARAGGSVEVAIADADHVRPNTLDLKPKVDIPDTPVIYDEQQFNVGTSPVIEDRRFLPND